MSTRLTQGYTRGPSFFDTHPGSDERAAANAVRAREMRWKRDPAAGDSRERLLAHLDGLEIGQRPEAGVFEGDRFVHPVLGFTLALPARMASPEHEPGRRRDGAARSGGRVPDAATRRAGDVEQVAQAWVRKEQESSRLSVEDSKPVKVGAIDAWRDRRARARSRRQRARATHLHPLRPRDLAHHRRGAERLRQPLRGRDARHHAQLPPARRAGAQGARDADARREGARGRDARVALPAHGQRLERQRHAPSTTPSSSTTASRAASWSRSRCRRRIPAHRSEETCLGSAGFP